jgi:hypothetical protein
MDVTFVSAAQATEAHITKTTEVSFIVDSL